MNLLLLLSALCLLWGLFSKGDDLLRRFALAFWFLFLWSSGGLLWSGDEPIRYRGRAPAISVGWPCR